MQGQTPSVYQLDFTKDYISWVWSANLQTIVPTGKQSRISVNNQLRSSLFRQSSQKDNWRDENTLEVYWQLPLSGRFSTRSIIESRIFSDDNSGRKFNKHLLAQELSWQVNPNIALKPAAGMALEESFDTADQGWYGKMGLEVFRLNMGEYLNYTDASSVIRAFPGRKNQEHTFFTGWTRQFSDRASDSLRLGYQYSENRYFIQSPAGSEPPQETVYMNTRFLFNQLQYNLSDHSFFAFLTNFKNRDIDQSISPVSPTAQTRRREELALENQLQHLMFWGGWQLQNSIFFSQSQNDNPNVDTDINTLQTAFTTALRHRSTRGNMLWGKFSFTKLEYNTPTPDDNTASAELRNRQDRDEQRFIIDAGYRKRFSEYFSAGLQGNVYLFHQIYLRSGRSQNNNWNRVYQLAATFDHNISPAVRHNQQIKILANYTVFDFEELLPTVRSYVFRKLVYSDSLSIDLTEDLAFTNIYQLEKEDNGSFFKDNFAQLINRELTAHFLNTGLRHNDVFGLQVTAGVTLFLRDEWGFTPQRERRKVRKFKSFSPRLTVVYPASKRLLVFLNYAPNKSENFTRSVTDELFQENIQYFTSGNVNLRYTF
ncbi:MAG: TonB-dependent receptor [Calditrichae bacterium]|nr:TonB-dependent receptor [Calditrichia bacterium]